MISERNYSEIGKDDLKALLKRSIETINNKFYHGNCTKWLELYNLKEPLCIALCQGAAMHYHDKSNGVKDYITEKFGKHPDFKEYKGRKVDVLVRSIRNYIQNDPIKTIYKYFENEKTETSKMLSKKAVVLLSPQDFFGKTIWYKKRLL